MHGAGENEEHCVCRSFNRVGSRSVLHRQGVVGRGSRREPWRDRREHIGIALSRVVQRSKGEISCKRRLSMCLGL